MVRRNLNTYYPTHAYMSYAYGMRVTLSDAIYIRNKICALSVLCVLHSRHVQCIIVHMCAQDRMQSPRAMEQ